MSFNWCDITHVHSHLWLMLSRIGYFLIFEDQVKVNNFKNDWKMIWHSSMNWSDTKHFFNLLSPRTSRRVFEVKFMEKMNSVEFQVAHDFSSEHGSRWEKFDWRFGKLLGEMFHFITFPRPLAPHPLAPHLSDPSQHTLQPMRIMIRNFKQFNISLCKARGERRTRWRKLFSEF